MLPKRLKKQTTPCIILNHNYETILMRIGNICGLRFRQLYPQKNCPEIPSSFSYKALITFMLPLRFLNFQSFVGKFFSHLWKIFQSFVDFHNNHLVFNHIRNFN